MPKAKQEIKRLLDPAEPGISKGNRGARRHKMARALEGGYPVELYLKSDPSQCRKGFAEAGTATDCAELAAGLKNIEELFAPETVAEAEAVLGETIPRKPAKRAATTPEDGHPPQPVRAYLQAIEAIEAHLRMHRELIEKGAFPDHTWRAEAIGKRLDECYAEARDWSLDLVKGAMGGGDV